MHYPISRPSLRHTLVVTTPELGILVIALNAITPADHKDEFNALRERFTLDYARRDPAAYVKLTNAGEVTAVSPPEQHQVFVATTS